MALAVTDQYGDGGHNDEDTPAVVAALLRRGIVAVQEVWHNEQADWSAYEAIIIRSPWDYSDRASEFDAWLRHASEQTRVINGSEMVRWNMDKRYLGELGSRAVPVVPTAYCSDLLEVVSAVRSLSSMWLVVKPTVSAGSRNTGLFRAGDGALLALAERILGDGKGVMIQPEIPALSDGQEKALFYFGGTFSHAVTKGALLAWGGGYLSGSYQEDPRAAAATEEELNLADLAMTVLRQIGSEQGWADANVSTPAYARFDVVVDDDFGPLLIEAELIEPSLYIRGNPRAARRYADAIASQLAL